MKFSPLVVLAFVQLIAGAAIHEPPADLTTPVHKDAYFVVFPSEPGSPAAKAEQARFVQQAHQLNIQYRTRSTFATLVNAVAIEADHDAIGHIARLQGVKEVFPLLKAAHPKVVEGDVKDPAFKYPHSATGVLKVHEQLKLTGKGIKVGIIDTGIDYTHPSLGGCFGKGCKVAYGYDFVGDDAQHPTPDDDPRDTCQGHGTHVAGIVAARDKDFVGVAPDVTLGAYRVLDCGGHAGSDSIIQGMERALADGMDIVNMSLGVDTPWKQYPIAVAAQKLAERGVVVVVAAGNRGTDGMWMVGAPSTAPTSLAVASFDSTRYLAQGMTVDGSDLKMDFGDVMSFKGGSSVQLVPFTSKEIVHVPIDDKTDCAEVKLGISVEGKLALVPAMESCVPDDLEPILRKGGAFAIVYYGDVNALDSVAYLGAYQTPTVTVMQKYAWQLLDMLKTGPVKVSLGTKPFVFDKPEGGFVSTFSSWGPGAELEVKPDIGAPGAFIYSTVPVNMGGYKTWSGTSMASPYMAGSIALYLQAKGKRTPQQVIDVFKLAAQQSFVRANSTDFASAFQQGAGFVQVYDAIQATTAITPTHLPLLSNDFKTGKLKPITITNNGKYAQRYIISHKPAIAVDSYAQGEPARSERKLAAQVDISTKDVVLQPGQSAKINLFFQPPHSADPSLRTLLSGYIVVTPKSTPDDMAKGIISRTPAMSIPYGGMYGNYKHLRVLPRGNDTVSLFPDMDVVRLRYPLGISCRLALPAQRVKLSLLNVQTNEAGLLFNGEQSYTGRGENAVNARFEGTYYDQHNVLQNATAGRYRIKLEALGPFEDPAVQANWESQVSKEFTLVVNREEGEA